MTIACGQLVDFHPFWIMRVVVHVLIVEENSKKIQGLVS
jgi:hypothetical protein